jgi:hypothetical protein
MNNKFAETGKRYVRIIDALSEASGLGTVIALNTRGPSSRTNGILSSS